MHFNSHAHVERDSLNTFSDPIDTDFNSHAHVERDMNEFYASGLTNISTHTLTWSVTSAIRLLTVRVLFQLTRSRGA